jgi:hypothetical protein
MSVQEKDDRFPKESISTWWLWIAVAVIVVFVAAIRIRLLQIPLERDEGEFAYMGQLMLQGIPPYFLAYNMKFRDPNMKQASSSLGYTAIQFL